MRVLLVVDSFDREFLAMRLTAAELEKLGVETRIRRLVGMLARKGYSGGVAMRVVREALADERELSLHESQVLAGLDVDLSDAARVGE